jgi:glycosyltransferase involved in cell wall biosynthesis
MSPQQAPKHIVWISRWYPNREDPQLGVFIQKQAEALAEHCRVSVICALPAGSGKTGMTIREQGNLLEIVHYYPKKLSPIARWIQYALAVQVGVREAIRQFGKPSLLLAYILNRSGIMARRVAKTYGVPFAVAEQWSGYASGAYSRKGWSHHRLTRRLCAEAAGIQVVSSFLQDAMERHGICGKYTVVPNIVEVNDDPLVPRNRTDTIEVLLVADLVDRIKNVADVIRCFATLYSRQPAARLTIVGDGPDRAMLTDLANAQSIPEGTIRFLGRLANDQVYEQLRRSDFLVMNSRVETFSLICAEAMSCGKPVIATRCGGPESFVIPETGILIGPDRPQELLEALERMCGNYESYDPDRIREHAVKRFSKAAVGRQLADLTETWMIPA